MWFPASLCFIASAFYTASAVDSTIFRKCCPKNHSLIRVATSNGEFDCVNSENAKQNYNITNFSRLRILGDVIIKDGLPKNCTDLKTLTTKKVEQTADENVCFDKLIAEVTNGTTQNIPKTISLVCDAPENATRSFFEVHTIRKCCPEGQAFDAEHYKCRDTNATSTVDGLLKWLQVEPESVYDTEIQLTCKYEQYNVILHEGKYNLKLRGSSLEVDGARSERIPSGEWCVDRNHQANGPRLVARVCTSNCSKYGAYCLKKCCPQGFHYKPFSCNSFKSACVPDDDGVLLDMSPYLEDLRNDYDNVVDVIGIGIGIVCPAGKYGLNRSSEADDHWLTKEGKLLGNNFEHDKFCVESFDWRNCSQGNVDVSTLACFIPDVKKNFQFSAAAITLSAVCLLITLLVYSSLPELHNLHGKTVICHAGTMLIAYSCLARVQYDKVGNPNLCKFLGYGIYFGFVSAFFWLNVMCFDIWWTFGSVRTVQTIRKSSSERRRFMWYSLYAWGVTLLFTLVMYLLDVYHVSDVVDANIGRGYCWFSSEQNMKSDYPHYIFFVVPMGVVTSINLVFWILTARHCAQVKSEVHRLQAGSVGDRVKKRFRVDRAKYVLTGKLWVVMGAGWISELLSTLFTQPPWLWFVIDLINELQGLFIFLLLVFKPKVYYLIKKRLGLVKPDAQKNGTSGRTSSTFLSRTISTDERAVLRCSLPNNDEKRA